MDGFLKIFEKFTVIVLILLMVVIIIVATFVTGSAVVQYIFSSPNYLIDDIELLDILGYILLILIGIELLETVKAYLYEHIIHVEVVLEVALIAVARKVILLDYKEYSGLYGPGYCRADNGSFGWVLSGKARSIFQKRFRRSKIVLKILYSAKSHLSIFLSKP